jgi:Ca2+-binding EF-hand superfamily protein
MSSISSALLSNTSQYNATRQSLFSRIDTNADGAVTKDEFVASRPQDVSADKAGALFDKMDTASSGSLTQSQMESGLKKNKPTQNDTSSLSGNLSSEVMAVLLQMAQEISAAGKGSNTASAQSSDGLGFAQPLSASDMFAKMDADGNGSVTKDEFVSSRPDQVSEEQAGALFDKMDTSSSGSITKEQFLASLPEGDSAQSAQAAGAGAPPPPPPGGGGGGKAADENETSFSVYDTDQDGEVSVEELLAEVQNVASDTASTSDSTDASTTNAQISELLNAIDAYMSSSKNTASTPSLTQSTLA